MLKSATTPTVPRSVLVYHACSLSHRFWLQSNPIKFKFVGLSKRSQSVQNPLSNFTSIDRTRKGNTNRSGMGTFTTRALAQPLKNPDDLIDSVETFIFDCDGVIWKGDSLIEGVPETLDMLRSKGKRLVFVTNNSTKSRKQYGKKFETLGLNVSEEEIFASSFAAAAYLRSIDFPKDKKVYVIGEDGILKELELAGYQYLGGPEDGGKKIELKPGFFMEHNKDVGAVVVGFDRHFNYYKIQYGTLCIRENPGCLFIATNRDAVTHLTDAQEWAGGGSMVGAISGSTQLGVRVNHTQAKASDRSENFNNGRRWGEPKQGRQTEALTSLLSKLSVNGGGSEEADVMENIMTGGMEKVVEEESMMPKTGRRSVVSPTVQEPLNTIDLNPLSIETVVTGIEKQGVGKEKEESMMIIQSKGQGEEERETRVLKEISINECGVNPIMVHKSKENIDPSNNIKDVRTWKRMARSLGALPKGEVGLVDGVKCKAEGEVKPDLIRCIGNGKTTSVWDDAWIPGAPTTSVQRPQNRDEEVETVSDLIDDSGRWKDDVINRLFTADIISKIVGIVLSCPQQEDKWVWLGDARGGFTVKACYKYYMARYWRDINLFPEMQGWVQSGAKNNGGYVRFALYLLWEWRNLKKFDSIPPRMEQLWCKVTLLWEEMEEVSCNEKGQEMTLCRWEKPSGAVVKLNADAGTLPSGGGIVGSVLRNSDGQCVGAFTERYGGSSNPMVLEAEAIKRGIEFALSLGIEDITVESDAKLVVDFLCSDGNETSPLLLICNQIKLLCGSFKTSNFTWVPRCCNKVAHFLVCLAKDSIQDVRWVDSLPIDVIRFDV
ncbi:phosphoglycolate phosphatase 1B, chloroplastic-like [Senna tora]|uniref:phosphoglycolate phosphatase n=1 Tax=Senna tora TaxID=362788 RepID=A0A834SJD5_9FABA|nr:phosphoglycolate phosphatase 1B, chloroplastic-like [Senna tora]